MPMFCQTKRPFSQEHAAPMSFFSKFEWKIHSCHAHIWSKKRQFCQNYTILWAKKSIGYLFFFRIFTIKYCSHAHILSKTVHSLINTLSSRPYFVKKMSIRSKTVFSRHFFQKFDENPLL